MSREKMPNSSKKTFRDLFRLAKLLGVKPSHGWMKQLAEDYFKVKQQVVSKWINRDRIPEIRFAQIEGWGLSKDQWCYDDKIDISSKSAPGSTISPSPDPSYAQPPEYLGHGAVRAQDKEGLHAHTQQIEVAGQRLTVAVYSPGREWMHRAVDEIMASDDPLTKSALESNLHAFVEKVRQRKELDERIAAVEQDLFRLNDSNRELKVSLAARHEELIGFRQTIAKTVSTHRPPPGMDERREAHKELHQILERISVESHEGDGNPKEN